MGRVLLWNVGCILMMDMLLGWQCWLWLVGGGSSIWVLGCPCWSLGCRGLWLMDKGIMVPCWCWIRIPLLPVSWMMLWYEVWDYAVAWEKYSKSSFVGWCVHCEWGGNVSMFSNVVRESLMMLLKPVVSVFLFRVSHSSGSEVRGKLCMMSPHRCGSLLIVCVWKRVSLVWRSVICESRVIICDLTELSCSIKNDFAKEVDQTGVQSKRKPSVNSVLLEVVWLDGWMVLLNMC